MPILKVTGTVNMNGEYEIEYPPYVQREWHEIKVKTGLRLGDLEDGFEKADADAFVAVAWVTLVRNGHDPRQAWLQLGEIDPYTALVFDFADQESDAEEDALPPVPTETDGDETETPSSDDATEPSSPSSKLYLAPPDEPLSATGSQP